MKAYNIYFENGAMYTSAGKDESDAILTLMVLRPELQGAVLLKVEPNGGTDESTD